MACIGGHSLHFSHLISCRQYTSFVFHFSPFHFLFLFFICLVKKKFKSLLFSLFESPLHTLPHSSIIAPTLLLGKPQPLDEDQWLGYIRAFNAYSEFEFQKSLEVHAQKLSVEIMEETEFGHFPSFSTYGPSQPYPTLEILEWAKRA